MICDATTRSCGCIACFRPLSHGCFCSSLCMLPVVSKPGCQSEYDGVYVGSLVEYICLCCVEMSLRNENGLSIFTNLLVVQESRS